MKLLITGGAGFIGSNFIHYILKKHPTAEVVNLDKLTYCGNPENLQDIENDPRYKFVQGDIADKKLLDDLFSKEKFDFIVHFAAETHVDRSIMNPFIFTETNVLGTHILLETARNYKIKKFCYISTDEVYGDIKWGKRKETRLLQPNNPYSATKAAATLLARSYFKVYNMPLIIICPSNNFGPFQFPEKLFPLFITNLLEGKKVPIYGNGRNVRQWLYVSDNCSAIDIILEKGEPGEVYNVGGENTLSNIQITKILLKLLGRDQSYIEYVPDRSGHDFRYALDSQKMKELGWKPKYEFREALENTINWYKNNPDWWQKLKNRSFQEYYRKQYKERFQTNQTN